MKFAIVPSAAGAAGKKRYIPPIPNINAGWRGLVYAMQCDVAVGSRDRMI